MYVFPLVTGRLFLLILFFLFYSMGNFHFTTNRRKKKKVNEGNWQRDIINIQYVLRK